LTRVGLFLSAIGCAALTVGCRSSRAELLTAEDSQVRLRAIQTRAFDTTDRNGTLRAVMATLQDLGFVLDDADEVLGTVSATRLDRSMVRMTVTVRPLGASQMLIRASAQYNLRAIADPEPYQRFFDALGKAMFLAAHNVD
jgi:hypothetical protein